MLTNVELDYMTVPAEKVPYPGDRYSMEALLEVRNAIVAFQDHYENRQFDIEFSNGENLVFEIRSRNLPHMLGMDLQTITAQGEKVTKELMMPNEKDHIYAFGLLAGIAYDPEKALAVNQKLDNKLFNFYRLKGRAEIFQEFSAFYNFNFGCLNFDKVISENGGYRTNMKSDRFLFIDSNNVKVPYYMMGLKRVEAEKEDICIETLFATQSLEKMFCDQTIAYPINVNINDGKTLVQQKADYTIKLNMLKKMKNIELTTGAKLEATYDQMISYSKLAHEEEKKVLEKKMTYSSCS